MPMEHRPRERSDRDARPSRRSSAERADQVPSARPNRMTGHLLGAAGQHRTIFSLLYHSRRVIPQPSTMRFPIRSATLTTFHAARRAPVQVAMSNAFGFGAPMPPWCSGSSRDRTIEDSHRFRPRRLRTQRSVKAFLTSQSVEVLDLGTTNEASVDYPDFGSPGFGESIQRRGGKGSPGLRTGIGMSVVANKFPRVRAALVHDLFSARFSREHNDANILVLGLDHREGPSQRDCAGLAEQLPSPAEGTKNALTRFPPWRRKFQILTSLKLMQTFGS